MRSRRRTTTAATTTQERAQPDARAERQHVDRVIAGRLARALRVITSFGVAFVLLGAGLGLLQDGRLPTGTVPASTLHTLLLDLEAEAFLTLGLLLFLAAPAVGLGYLAQAFLRVRERLYALVALLLLAILAGSVLIAVVTRGG